MTPAPIVASLAEQPAYYALYALYVDYLANNQAHRAREYFARLYKVVTYIQPLLGLEQPYQKSWSLRLFTEREALARFSPERASTAWWLVRQAVDEIGPPAQSHMSQSKARQRLKMSRPSRTAPSRPTAFPGQPVARVRSP